MKRPDPAVLRLLLFSGGLIAVLVVLIVFSDIFQPLLLGLGLAYLFDPMVSWIERRGRSRTFGIVVIVLMIAIVLTGFFLYVIPETGDQVQRLREKLPEYTERLRTQSQDLLARFEARFPEQFEEFRTRAVESFRENSANVARALGRQLTKVFQTVGGAFLFIINLIFVPVFAFYLLVDLPKIKSGITQLLPLPYRDVIVERVKEMDGAVASFLRGQLVIAIILATINAVGLWLIDVPLGLMIGIIAGLANMIPYMSLVVGLLPAVLLCYAEHQSWVRVIAVIAVFSGAQMLEGTVLSPKILSKSVNLHPVWVLLAIIAGGSLFGFFGMLIAVPAAAAIQVFLRHWIVSYRQSKIYSGERDRDDEEADSGAEEGIEASARSGAPPQSGA